MKKAINCSIARILLGVGGGSVHNADLIIALELKLILILFLVTFYNYKNLFLTYL